MRRWALAAVVLVATTVSPGGVDAQEQPAARSVTVEPTTFAEGDPVTVTGTGCVDPETGSGDGLFAVTTFGDPVFRAFHDWMPVADDGTFSATTTARQPHPHGDAPLVVRCTRGATPDAELVWEDAVWVLRTGTALTVLGGDVEIGRSFEIVSPCNIPAGERSWLHVDLLPLFSTPRYSADHLPGPIVGGTVVQVGQTAGLDPGSYHVRATCESDGAFFAEFSLTVRFVAASAPPDALPATS